MGTDSCGKLPSPDPNDVSTWLTRKVIIGVCKCLPYALLGGLAGALAGTALHVSPDWYEQLVKYGAICAVIFLQPEIRNALKVHTENRRRYHENRLKIRPDSSVENSAIYQKE